MNGEVVLIDDEDESPPPTQNQPPPIKEVAAEPKQPETTEAATVQEQEKETIQPKDIDKLTDEILKLYNECFPSETIFILDVDGDDKTSKSNQCMIMNCTSDSPLAVPPKYVQSFYHFPEGNKTLICNDCITMANNAVKDRCAYLEAGESVFLAPFPTDDPVVILDSDDESEEIPDIKKFEKDTFTDDLSPFIKQIIDSMDLDKQYAKANAQNDESLTRNIDIAKALADEAIKVDNDLYKEMKEMYEVYYPPLKMLPPVILPSVQENRDIIVIEEDDNIGRIGVRGKQYIQRSAERFGKNSQSTRPVPKVGDNCYVVRHSDVNKHSEWVPAQIEECIGKTVENGKEFQKYRVKMHRGKGTEVYKKEVDSSQMAYFQPDAVKLDIGSRIIALHHSVIAQKKFHSGIIAELPTRLNKYRFLIFFDHGYTQYATTDEIRNIVDTKKLVHEYFDAGSQEFIIQYLKSFPERPMLRVSDMELVSTEFKGSWVNARVMRVDASLIKVVFLNDRHEEWLYRGSPRLRPVYDKARQMKKQEVPGSKVRHRGTTVHRNLGPYIQYEVIHSDDSDPDDPDASGDVDDSSDSNSRAVARKSTSRVVMPDMQLGRYLQMSPPRRTSERRVTRQDFGRVQVKERRDEAENEPNPKKRKISKSSVIKRVPNGILSPRVFRPHKCTTYCVSWVSYDEDKTKGINPLAIPAIYAFKRDIEGSNVSYVAPCGRKLRGFEELLAFLRDTKLPLTVDLFDFDPNVRIFDEFVVAPEHILIDDITRGSENVPIPCINSQDACIPDLMEYMTERRGTEGVTLNTDPGFLIGCDCTDNCQDRSKCLCWQQTLTQAKAFNFNTNTDDIGYKYKRLKELILTGIYECNSRCKCCTKTCLNRVVQQPLKIKLQLFKTKKKGWGTRCVNDIPAGTFICVYVGNILTERYANETGRAHGDEYFAELDYIEVLEDHKENYEENVPEELMEEETLDDKWDGSTWVDRNVKNSEYIGSSTRNTRSTRSTVPNTRSQKAAATANKEPRHEGFNTNNSDDEDGMDYQPQSSFAVVDDSEQADEEKKTSVRSYYGEDEAVYVMDAKIAGNIGRYLNHSCDPNIFVQNVFVDTHDLRFPWVSFFALKYIPAGTELTWNYGYNIDSVPGKKLYCYCGAQNCRRRLL